MKIIISSIFCLIINIIVSQNKSALNISEFRIDENIAQLVTYNVIIKDTASSHKSSQFKTGVYTNGTYLDTNVYHSICALIKRSIENPNSFIGYPDGSVIFSQKEIKKKINHYAGNVASNLDINNNKTNQPTSNWIYENIAAIDFTESWTIDPKTDQIKKEILAYSILGPVSGKEEL